METLVSQMTPVVIVEAITADGDNWKIESCNTYWLAVGKKITIDGVVYRIVDFDQDNYIIVSGSVEPTISEFQIPAPGFAHGTRRKVNRERPTDVTEPWVYFPTTRSKPNNDEFSSLAYTASIAPIFLMDYDTQKDTTKLQQEEVVRPLIAMTMVFLELINDQLDKFEEPDDYEINQHMNIGLIEQSGNVKSLFNENLSGVQLTMSLQGYESLVCDCPDEPTKFCEDVNSSFNGTATTSTPSGETKAVIVQTNDLVPVQTGVLIEDNANEMTIEVVAAGAVPINTANLFKTGANSIRTGDDGTLNQGRGVDFFTLDFLNGFGVNANRFTDDLGGQTYANDLVIDWSTWNQIDKNVLCYLRAPEPAQNQNDHMDGEPYTRLGETDWNMVSDKQIFNLYKTSVFRNYLNYSPINIVVVGTSGRIWTNTTESTGVGMTFQGATSTIEVNTAIYRTFLQRTYLLTELGL